MRKDKFFKNIDDFNKLIDIEKEKIIKSKIEIRRLEDKKVCHMMTCKHEYENGESAIEDTSHWVPDIHYYECSWTGEEMEEDNGYTVYGYTCSMCDKDIDEYDYKINYIK